MISAIVMAAGFSTRMGENKLLMDYNNKPIIKNILEILSKCEFAEVIVVSQYKDVLDIAKEYKFKYVLNDKAKLGQSESIKLGLLNSSNNDGYMFFVGDQPLISVEDIEKIIDEFKKNNDFIVIPTHKGRRGNPVIFPNSQKKKLLNLKLDERGKKVIDEYNKKICIEVKKETLMDIDTKEDYQNLINTHHI